MWASKRLAPIGLVYRHKKYNVFFFKGLLVCAHMWACVGLCGWVGGCACCAQVHATVQSPQPPLQSLLFLGECFVY